MLQVQEPGFLTHAQPSYQYNKNCGPWQLSGLFKCGVHLSLGSGEEEFKVSRISEPVLFRVLNKKVESHTHTHMTLTARLRGRQKLRMIRAICDSGLKARWVQVSCSLLGWLSRLMEGLPEIETLGPALINLNAVPALEHAPG